MLVSGFGIPLLRFQGVKDGAKQQNRTKLYGELTDSISDRVKGISKQKHANDNQEKSYQSPQSRK